MKKYVFATNNAHKLEEVKDILGDKIELLSMKDINCQTDIPETALGDTATLVDAQPCSPLSAKAVAVQAGTIPNELLCRLGERLPRVVLPR